MIQHNCSLVVQLISYHQQSYEAVLTAKIGEEMEILYRNKGLCRQLWDEMRREM